MDFVETPLGDAVAFLADQMPIGFDTSALPENRRSMPVTMSGRGVPWRHALALMLDDLDLRAEARGGDTIVILPPKPRAP
jgi:hypothetical protein